MLKVVNNGISLTRGDTAVPRETDNLAYGTYYYDIELRRPDGFVATVIPPHILKLTEEVTF